MGTKETHKVLSFQSFESKLLNHLSKMGHVSQGTKNVEEEERPFINKSQEEVCVVEF